MLKSKSTSAALFVGAATGRTLNYHTQKKFRRLAAAKFKSKAVKINGIVKVKSKVNVNYASLAARRQGKAACGCLAATTCRFSPAHNEPKTCHTCCRRPCIRTRSSSTCTEFMRSWHSSPWRSTSSRSSRHSRNCHPNSRSRQARPKIHTRPCRCHYHTNRSAI